MVTVPEACACETETDAPPRMGVAVQVDMFVTDFVSPRVKLSHEAEGVHVVDVVGDGRSVVDADVDRVNVLVFLVRLST